MNAERVTSMPMRGLLLFLLGACAAVSLRAAEPPLANEELEIGRRIYQEGLLPSGAPLTGVRLDGAPVSGAAAACISCHRRSGMGAVEGDILIPPISGNYLFGLGRKNMVTMDPRRGKALNQAHAPYTEASLAQAIRRGENNSGRAMSLAMPRYALADADLQALTAYLRQLSSQWSPGVTPSTIRFATVITPGVEATRRQALLDLMRTAVAQKNGSTLPGRRHMVSPAEMLSRTERTWMLDVWELQGPPETWAAQLEDKYRRQPVFALVSGISGGTWQPVHDFCERVQVPCWFPSVDLPPATSGFYPVYFSRGVALEADVLASYLQAAGKRKPQRLVQYFRDDDVGRGAARAMGQALAGSGIGVENRLFESRGDDMRYLLAGIGKNDVLMFWLRPDEVAALERVWPDAVASAYFSASLGGAERMPLPAAWKGKAHLVYPYELPDRRRANLAYFHDWLRLRKLPLVDEKLQSEAYFSLAFLTDTLAEMLDNLYGDYLLERAENMLSRREAQTAEQEEREGVLLGWKGKTAMGRLGPLRDTARMTAEFGGAAARMHESAGAPREGTTVYPRLGLGPDQRFASKGGYVVRFSSLDGDRLVAESPWIVP